MSNKVELMNSLNIPSFLVPYFDTIYDSSKIDIMYALVDNKLSAEEISEKLGYKAYEQLDELYRNAIVDKTMDENTIKYKLSTLNTRINVLSTFHRDIWESIPSGTRKMISEWHFGEFLNKKKRMEFPEIIKNQNSIVPLDEAVDYLMSVDDDIYVIPCDCRSISDNCDYSKETCITLGKSKNPSIERGYGRKISKDEALDILNSADKEGLIHTAELHAICNCCTCCCYPMRASKELGLEKVWPKINYVISIDKDKCVGCGLCVKKCQKDVFSLEDRKIDLNTDNCVGCGVCVNTCPKGALSLISLNEKQS